MFATLDYRMLEDGKCVSPVSPESLPCGCSHNLVQSVISKKYVAEFYYYNAVYYNFVQNALAKEIAGLYQKAV